MHGATENCRRDVDIAACTNCRASGVRNSFRFAAGATIVCGTEHEGLYATVRKRSDHKLVLRSVLDNGEARQGGGRCPRLASPCRMRQ